MFDQIGTQDPKVRERGKPRDLSEEVKAFRQLIRSKDYLSNPKTDRHLISLDNEMLNQDLVNFSARSREKRALYFDAYMNHEEKRTVVRTTIPFKQDPVFVTMTEKETHEALENKTIEMIKSEIEYMLSHLSDENIKEAFTETWQHGVLKRKGAAKKDYVAFHEELCYCMENSNDYVEEIQDYET